MDDSSLPAFLLMALQSLFAYHIEALVPSSPGAANASQTPQKLSGNKDVQFFTVGHLSGRTLVIYMKKKNVRDFGPSESKRLLTCDALQLDSVFRVLEPVIGKINEKTKAQPSIGSRFGLRSQRSEWFRVYRVGFIHHPYALPCVEPFAFRTSSCLRTRMTCCS